MATSISYIVKLRLADLILRSKNLILQSIYTLLLITFTASGTMAANRSLTLYNTHTKETTTITYKRNGKFDAAGLRKLNRFVRDWRRNEITRMDPTLFDLIWQIYKETGARKPIHIVSGYRSPATNSMLRGRSRNVAKNSRHTKGQALDFYLPGVPIKRIRDVGLRLQAGGVGYYPSSRSPFVHIDTGNVRHWPRMTRSQLAKVFPRGNTVHVPRDGKPFSGYKQAKRTVARRKADMIRTSRSVRRFTQVARAAPSTPPVKLASLARPQPKQEKTLLNSLLEKQAKPRTAPKATTNKRAPIELTAPAKTTNAPVKLAVLPRSRAPLPAKSTVTEQPQTPDLPAQSKPITLASLPRARPANIDSKFQLASAKPSQSEAVSSEIQPAQSNMTASPQTLASMSPTQLPKQSPQNPPAQFVNDAEQNVQDMIARLTEKEKPGQPAENNRFAYASSEENFLAQLPSAAPNLPLAKENALQALPRNADRKTIASLSQDQTSDVMPRPKPAQELAKNTVSKQQAQQAPRKAMPGTNGRNDLAKLTFAYGPSAMRHFAHLKQSTKTATFARLSRPIPNNLHALVLKPSQMIDQSFSQQRSQQITDKGFFGTAIGQMAIRRFN